MLRADVTATNKIKSLVWLFICPLNLSSVTGLLQELFFSVICFFWSLKRKGQYFIKI